MKKLLFILSALLISMLGWAANKTTLNPYAYNLSSTWNEETQELTVRFTLNAHPNLEQYKVNDKATNSCGIQIYAIDPANPSDRYYIYGVPGDVIRAKMNIHNDGKGDSYDYECTIPIDGMTKEGNVANRRPLPAGKDLTWAVTVQGVNNTNQSTPVVVEDNIANRPFSCHGIAVNNNQNSADFGSIYVTEASEGTDNGLWKWIKDQNKGRSLLKYTPRLDQVEAYRKFAADGITQQNFSLRNGYNLLEPHKVRISDDGRIFVSSYNRNTSNDKVVVWEFDKNTKQFKPIISHNTNYGHRVCAMDVKGSGNNLKILLCYFSEDKKYNSTFQYAFAAYEYSITSSNTYPISTGAKRILYQPGMGSSLTDYSYGQGVLHWTRGKQISTDPNPNTSNGYFYSDGLVNIAYGKTNNTDIFFAFDYFYSSTFNTRTMYYKNCTPNNAFFSGTVDYHTMNESNHYLGGAGFLTYKDGSNEYLVAGHAKNYLIANNAEGDGRVQVYPFDRSKSDDNISYTAKWTVNTKTKACINDMAMDHANNIYAISFSDGTSTTPGTGRLIAIALPYGGATTTIAPSSQNNKFTIPPVPNILATDLTYAPYGNENKYEFSFNVNTKPELARIRFYENEADMLANNENYSFYYEFSERKQGRMSVIFDAVGGTVENKLLNDPDENGHLNLPRGEYYWNVYVKTRRSCAFAPIYTQPAVGASDFHRQHATVDNNPNNRGFGHIYVADHHNIENSKDRVHYVRAYTIGNATGNAQQDNQSDINDETRYTTHWQVRNTIAKYMRRPAVAPDGMVYVIDEGANNENVKNDITYGFVGAGMWVLDPNNQTNDGTAVWNTPNFSTKTPNQEVTTAASFLKKDGKWYLYKTNTYEEVTFHGDKPGGTNDLTTNTKWQANGYRIYTLNTAANGALVHSGYDDAQSVAKPFGGGNDTYKCGDTNGQFSIIATENGVWMCQHREGKVVADDSQANPDGKNGVALSFFNHSGTRTFTSTAQSALTQKTNSILQSTPGGGMAYQKRGGVEYLYVVNHAGNILEFKITGGAAPTLTHTQTYETGNGTKGVKYGAISSMNFDYAGNLVVTAGATYGVNGTDVNGNNVVRDHQELVIYTMPYPNQENARAIPASEMYRYIPERVADDFRELDLLLDYRIANPNERTCYVDIYRPMLTDMLNTICLPFNINTKQLDATDYYDATLLKFSQAVVTNQNGEKILELQFTADEDGVLEAGVPYLIQAKNPITGIVQLKQEVTFTQKQGQTVHKEFNDGQPNSIDFKGIMSTQLINIDASKPWPLILVDNNRLAEVKNNGNMRGFRAYFQLAKELDPGTKVGISARKPTPTNVITIDGKRVNIEKFLREGRVYIRVGDSLYTISGEKVE